MLLFLGSGVSLASGLPGVDEITTKVLEGSYFQDPDQRGIFYEENDIEGRDVKPVKNIQNFLSLLKTVDEHHLKTIAPYSSGGKTRYTGSIYRQQTSYEDLIHLSEQINQCGVGLTDNAMTAAFVAGIEEQAKNLLPGETPAERLKSLVKLSRLASGLIEWVVAKNLKAKKIEGLDLIVDLAKNATDERLDIVTLNHDTLVEQLLDAHNIPYVDGFGPRDGDVRWYDDSSYDSSDARVRIFKPHGSANWFRFSGNSYPAMVVGSGPQNCHTANGTALKNYTSKPSFLSGGAKVIAYNKDIFSEMFYRFHQALREQNFMIMSGYGWGDTPVNFRIMNWMGYGPQNKIMLLHERPDELSDRCMTLDEVYGSFVENGRMILANKWLSDTTYDDVEQVFAR